MAQRDKVEMPKLERANWHLVCDRCGETLGGHLGYRCLDDKGTFVPKTAEITKP